MPGRGRFNTEDTHWSASNRIYGDNATENLAPNLSAIRQGSNLYQYCLNNPIAFIVPTGCYNRAAAVAYARDWARNRNESYYDYSSDCANFVSQCLFAGGIKMNSRWFSYRSRDMIYWGDNPKSYVSHNYRYDWNISEPWRLVTSHYQFFSDPSNGYM